MSATSHGAGCGVVLGIVIVLFLQQISYLDLSGLVVSIEDLLIAAVIGGILGALIGWALGKRYLARHAASPASTGK